MRARQSVRGMQNVFLVYDNIIFEKNKHRTNSDPALSFENIIDDLSFITLIQVSGRLLTEQTSVIV